MMTCPKCQHHVTRIVDGRSTMMISGAAFRRRRICLQCKFRWTTLEVIAERFQRLRRRPRHQSRDTDELL